MADDRGLLQSAVSVLDTKTKLIAAVLALTVLFTRLLSGVTGGSKRTPRGTTVPLVPYWIPIIGHVPQFFFFRKSFFKWARQTYREGAFALNMLGTTHYVVFKPAFGWTLLNARSEVADSEKAFKYIMQAVFAWPEAENGQYEIITDELHDLYRMIQSSPDLPDMIEVAARELKHNINDLVTFSESPVDMPYWERRSNAHVVKLPDGRQGMEVNLYQLVRDFSVINANTAIFGTDLQNNNPHLIDDLWKLDEAFMLLAAGLPGWVPIPGLTRGRLAQSRLINAFNEWERAMVKFTAGEDPGSEWSNLDDVGALLKARIPVYEKYNLSTPARSTIELSLLWAANANAHPLVFWIVANLYNNPEVLAAVREEVAPYMKIAHPSGEFGEYETPQLSSVDHVALAESCPLLKASYIESLRLDVGGWSYKVMQQDLTIRSRDKGSDQEFLIPAGTYCHVAHELHHMDPEAFPEPEKWVPQRHLKPDPHDEKKQVADMGNIRPYGGGAHMCKGRHFAMREILLFVAAIVTFWDMHPPLGQEGWKMPPPKDTVGTHAIKGEMRVVVTRRKIPKV